MSWARIERVQGGGAHLVVAPWAGRPSWHVEGSNWNGYSMTRVVSGGISSAWYLIDDWWDDLATLTSERAPRALRALTARDVDAASHRGSPGSPEWRSWWTGRLADALIEAPHPPLARGERYGLDWADDAHVSAEHFPRFVARETFYRDIPSRAMPRPDSGRVKFWRKHARAGTLPPVVLMHLDCLGDVIVDGHARAVAASEEGVPAPRMILRRLAWQDLDEAYAAQVTTTIETAYERSARHPKPMSESTIRGFNRALIDSHARGWGRACARVWPLEGGGRAWMDEVLAEALRLEDRAQRDDAVGVMTWMRAQGFS